MDKKKLKAYRLLANISKEEMAKELGLKTSNYYHKEMGYRNFKVEEIKGIYHILKDRGLDITLEDLL